MTSEAVIEEQDSSRRLLLDNTATLTIIRSLSSILQGSMVASMTSAFAREGYFSVAAARSVPLGFESAA
jgi:hypothetical protein